MYEETVDLYDQGKLAGILHLPVPSKRPCPLIIYCPGKNGERYEVHRLAVKFARYLAKKGIGFLRFDYYGLGLSDGHYHEMTTSTKVSNVLKAYEYVQTLDGVSQNDISFLGFSDGARIALMAANRTKVNRLILWSPLFYEFGGNFPNGKHPRFSRHPRFPNVLVMPWAGLWVGIDFYYDLKKIDIPKELNDYTGESIIIYGDDDPLIEEEFENLQTTKYRIYNNDQKNQVEAVEGAGHLFTSRKFEDELMDLSYQWLSNSKKREKGETQCGNK